MSTLRTTLASHCRLPLSLVVLALATMLPSAMWSQSVPEFQDFFLDVCSGGGTSGELEARCQDGANFGTGRGELSGDSEVSLNPSQLAAINQSTLSSAMAAIKEVQERMEIRRESLADDASGDPASSGLPERSRWSFLANGSWEYTDRDATSRERGWDGDKWSAQFGGDYAFSSQAFLGALVTLDWGDHDFDGDKPGGVITVPSSAGGIETEGYALTLFGSYNFTEEIWLDGHFGGGYTDYEFKRRATFQDNNRQTQTFVTAQGDSEGGEIEAGLGAGYDTSWKGLSGGPYARLDYVWTTVDGYSESDSSGLQMRVDGESQDSLVSVLGLRGSYALSTPIGIVLPHVRIEYEHEFLRDHQTTSSRYVQDAARTGFRWDGDDPDRNYGNAGAGLSLVMQDGWMTFVDYEAIFEHSYYERHRISFGVRKEL